MADLTCRDTPAQRLTPYQPSAHRSTSILQQIPQAVAVTQDSEQAQMRAPAAEATVPSAGVSPSKTAEVQTSDAVLMAEEARKLAASLRNAEQQTLLENTAGDSAVSDDSQEV
jgi:hypothetical protein